MILKTKRIKKLKNIIHSTTRTKIRSGETTLHTLLSWLVSPETFQSEGCVHVLLFLRHLLQLSALLSNGNRFIWAFFYTRNYTHSFSCSNFRPISRMILIQILNKQRTAHSLSGIHHICSAGNHMNWDFMARSSEATSGSLRTGTRLPLAPPPLKLPTLLSLYTAC